MRTATALLLLGLGLAFAPPAAAQQPQTTQPVILSPTDGATVASPVIITVKPADPNSTAMAGMGPGAHVHLLVDSPLPTAGSMVAMDARHIHLMHGETSATLPLAPGRHTIQLIEGTMGHTIRPNAPHSDPVTFQVK
jgi:hypothetical protein